MTDSDSVLLDRMLQGDDLAFEALFLRHYAGVYRVLYGLVRVREWAEDLAQDTFLELYRNPPRSYQGSSLLAWLCRVALNRGYNSLKGEGRSRQRAEQVERRERAISHAEHPDPAVEVLRAEENRRVREVLASLPERQCRLLLLRYAGLSYAECAEALEVAPGSIGTLLVRAERAFRAAYGSGEEAGQPGQVLLERTVQ
ncbi:MAG: sigma-70 family RNA polymerase sigma factor [Chloroflexota bacterium]|nr:sigma-70 family RNA polymerase sigma factor [Chloroflexota bacterium]MDQ5866112.1 sigma-70 family RNA polymerase sigma factor [Chloroflexota bacterium]